MATGSTMFLLVKDTLGNAMKNLFQKAQLSKIYTNHSIRHSVVDTLEENNFEARHIMAATGHKLESSICQYTSKCPPRKRREMFECLLANHEPKKSKPTSKLMSIATSTVSVPPPQNHLQIAPGMITPTEKNSAVSISNVMNTDWPECNQIYDNFLVDVLIQIEDPNSHVVQHRKSMINPFNMSRVSNNPPMPRMYFSNSTVTINYNYKS